MPSHKKKITLSRVWSGAKYAPSQDILWYFGEKTCLLLLLEIKFNYFFYIVESKSFHNLLCQLHDSD